MKQRLPALIVFAVLLGAAVGSGYHSYNVCRDEMAADLSQALAKCLDQDACRLLPTDTIRAYAQAKANTEGPMMMAIGSRRLTRHLRHKNLADAAFITFDTDGDANISPSIPEGAIGSDTLTWYDDRNQTRVALRSYASVSVAGILASADMSGSLGLFVMALLWGSAMWLYPARRSRHSGMATITTSDRPTLNYDPQTDTFLGRGGENIHLTPMQHRLMKMFLAAPRHQLSHQTICQTLWPKKDQPADTLYALIKRLKPILEEQMNVKIECQRGRYYRLTADETSHP